jgi:acetyl-CoA carboxylase carboxyl transferase subunit beta
VGVKKDSDSKKNVDAPNGWVKCPGCAGIFFLREIERNQSVCTACEHHFRIGARKRIELTTDPGTFEEYFGGMTSTDPLGFVDKKPYPERVADAREKTGLTEAVVVGTAALLGRRVVLMVMDFEFLGGSMGSVVGEKVARAAELSLEKKIPLISFAASGGARMQEGLISLMQMAKTTAAISRLKETDIPYISILTDPTTGGVAASFAMLGDVIIAEPGATIGFAGRRVIEQTINQKPPEDFQKSRELLKHGLIDMIVQRKNIKATINKLLTYLFPHETAS